MKQLIYLLIAVMVGGLAASCSSSKLTPEQRRERAVADSLAHQRSAELLTIRSFLIKARTIRIASIGTKEVIPEHNFIMVNNGHGVVNFSPYFSGGPNGVGGSTYEGTVENYKETIKDNGEIFITFKIAKGTTKAEVSIMLPKNSSRAMVTVNGYATLYGVPEPYDPSKVIEGLHFRP